MRRLSITAAPAFVPDGISPPTVSVPPSADTRRASTIRYYESIGVLPRPEREAGQRRYGIDVLRRLAIIDIAQRAGFTLE